MKWRVIFFSESAHTEKNLGYVEAETLEGAYKECGADQKEMETKYRDEEDSITIIEYHDCQKITSPEHLLELIAKLKQEDEERAKVGGWVAIALIAGTLFFALLMLIIFQGRR